MRNPIWIEEARAAQDIHYSLARACASLPGFSVRPPRPHYAGKPRGHTLGLATLLLWVAILGCSDDGASSASFDDSAGHAAAEPTDSAVPPSSDRNAAETPVVVFLGTSLTAGYGIEEDQAFPALIQQRIHDAALDYRVINAGVSGDTSAGGLRRLDWLLRLPVSVLVLELGANDMLRGQGVEQLRSNLDAILDTTARDHPNARFVVVGMRAAPNLGREYGEAFDAVYPELAERHDAAFVPFLLEDVAARRHLNQADGIHPTEEGHALIAERVWKTLEPVLR
jgi:acyl-CoA thioesterase-1